MATYEELRQRHLADAAALLPQLVERIEWPAERLAAHRRTELQRLVRVARELSPWHRKRLSDVDPGEVDEATLADLPVMTKDDLMAHFDEIVTDDRLRLDVVEAHLEALTTDAYLFDRYHACASGGSSGRRGVFVYDWDGWSTCYWGALRYEARARRLDPRLAAAPPRMALVAADAVTHISSSLAQTFWAPGAEWHRFPVTLPVEEIVAGLNAVQPTLLAGYPSALYGLAHEVEAGRLHIAPLRLCSTAEPLLPEIRAALEETWHAPVVNVYSASEGLGVAVSCGLGAGLHLSEDLYIVEPVDAAGRPVGSGVCSDKVYLTNLFNHALPHAPGRTLPLWISPPTDRRSTRPSRRLLRLQRGDRPPARLPLPARTMPSHRRVPGPPDAGRGARDRPLRRACGHSRPRGRDRRRAGPPRAARAAGHGDGGRAARTPVLGQAQAVRPPTGGLSRIHRSSRDSGLPARA